ncbi:MAG: twin-arginine translocase subunit TatC [Candidatus Azosocius agrarius]|nr:MAG: twin-arginine translocase subunit TatC [Gammaproteobacteria bacterium]
MNLHFIELRKRIINCFIFIICVFLILFSFSQELYSLIAKPIIKQLPEGNTLIATHVTTPFLIPLKLTFLISIIISIPYFISNIWNFISPGLYKNEKTKILPIIIYSIILFYIGLLFSFYIICPLALNFFTTCISNSITIMTDISNYLDFIISISIATGISFQIPIITILIIKFNFISKKDLTDKRKYVIILAFILGMLLTPPDVISQILLAIPIWILFEIGILLSKNEKT